MEKDIQWTSATPASLFLVFAVTVGFFAFLTGRINGETGMLLLGLWVLMIGSLWVIAAIIDFRMGDVLGGCINGVLGILLGTGTGGSLMAHAWAVGQGMTIDGRIDGWLLLTAGIIFIPFAFCAARRLWLLALSLLNLGIAFILIALVFIGFLNPAILPLCGWELLGSGILMLYLGSGFILLDSFGKPILPLGGPLY
jgi:hypothetical protein